VNETEAAVTMKYKIAGKIYLAILSDILSYRQFQLLVYACRDEK
jgi:hypothetical protein